MVLLSAFMVPMSVGTYLAYSSVLMIMMIVMIVRIKGVIILALKLDKAVDTIKLNKAIAAEVGNSTLTHTIRALFKVAYHQGEEVILLVVREPAALPNFFIFMYYDIG